MLKSRFILLALLVHRLVIVNDNVKGVPARRLYRDKLLVGVLVIEQIAGNKVALLREALARFDGGSGSGAVVSSVMVGSP